MEIKTENYLTELGEIKTKNYLTELREINGTQIVAILNDQSTLHVVTRKDPFGREAEPNTRVPVDICYD